MSNLLLMNLPYNASDREIRNWVESRGIETKSIRIIRDLVTGTSPAFGHVELNGRVEIDEAISILDGKKMRDQTICAKEVITGQNSQRPIMPATIDSKRLA